MANLSLRNLDRQTAARLKEEARRRRMSVNSLLLEMVRDGIERGGRQQRRAIYHDLDALAGTWTARDARAFERALKTIRKVDIGLWR